MKSTNYNLPLITIEDKLLFQPNKKQCIHELFFLSNFDFVILKPFPEYHQPFLLISVWPNHLILYCLK